MFACYTAHKMKFSIKDFFSKCDQIRRKLRIWSHLLKKSLMENFIFCAVLSRFYLSVLFRENTDYLTCAIRYTYGYLSCDVTDKGHYCQINSHPLALKAFTKIFRHSENLRANVDRYKEKAK